MGNLFYRRQPVSEIKAMTYHELKYWNEWHKILDKQEAATARKITDG